MGWKRYKYTWYHLWQGLYTQEPVADMPVAPDTGSSYLAQATNIYAPGLSRVLRKRPGFTKVRSTAITGAPAITGMVHLGEIADEFILAASDGKYYRDNANPPGALSGGTDGSTGADNLVDWVLFTDGTNPVAISATRLRNAMQKFVAATTRSDFQATNIAQYIEVLGQRLLYGAPNIGGTVFDDRVYWSALRDGDNIADTTKDFLSFETKEKDRVRAVRKFSDVAMVGKLNNIFLMAVAPSAAQPFVTQEVAGGRYKGPVSQQATLEADQRLFWMGQTNIHSLAAAGEEITDWADVIKPTIAGLNDDRREFTVAGHDVERNLLLFAVSDGTDTTHKTIIALNYKTGALYLWTLSRNAFAPRLVTDEHRLIGGGYAGFFYNEMTGTAGDLDDATAVIDADVLTPRFFVAAYGTKQKIPHVLISVDPIGSEQLTVQYRLDDDTAWSTPTDSPITVSGTDTLTKAVTLNVYAERLQLRFRNNRADEVYSVKAVGLPALVGQPVVA